MGYDERSAALEMGRLRDELAAARALIVALQEEVAGLKRQGPKGDILLFLTTSPRRF